MHKPWLWHVVACFALAIAIAGHALGSKMMVGSGAALAFLSGFQSGRLHARVLLGFDFRGSKFDSGKR